MDMLYNITANFKSLIAAQGFVQFCRENNYEIYFQDAEVGFVKEFNPDKHIVNNGGSYTIKFICSNKQILDKLAA